MTNLPKLAEKLNKHGLMQKAFYDMTEKEITLLCQAVLDSIDTECGWQYACDQVPYYKAHCPGNPDKCKRAYDFARNSIPKRFK